MSSGVAALMFAALTGMGLNTRLPPFRSWRVDERVQRILQTARHEAGKAHSDPAHVRRSPHEGVLRRFPRLQDRLGAPLRGELPSLYAGVARRVRAAPDGA